VWTNIMTDPRLIDTVAREMTAGEPAAEFRARVLERVAATASVPRSRWRAPVWLGVAATAAAGVFVALTVFRAPQPPTVPAGVVAVAGDAAIATDAAVDPVAAEAADPAAQRAAPRVEAPVVPASVLAWRARAIPELSAVEPLAFDDIQPERLSITQLDVTPLDILPISFPPRGGESGGR
jgi:hypothetical protein